MPLTRPPRRDRTANRLAWLPQPVVRRVMIVESVVYAAGRRLDAAGSLEEMREDATAQRGVAWVELERPPSGEFGRVAETFALHELAVEDAIVAHQRSKLERYGETLLVVLRAANYRDRLETVEFAELHVFVGPEFVITVRHGAGPDLSRVRRRLEAEPDLLAMGPEAILYAILDRVVDDYGPVVRGLENDIDEIEVEVFGGNAGVTRRTYELAREVIEFQRATKPLVGMIGGLLAGAEKYNVDPALRENLRDVQDHAIQIQEQVASFRELLQNVLSVNLAVVGLQQNEEVKALTQASIEQNDEVKRISSWAAILFAPTLIGTVYGMNFEQMPELHWAFGYPFALFLMLITSATMYFWFQKRGWLS